MATTAGTVDHILDGAGAGVTARPMFGEYALYRDGRVVALVCDDALFVKPTGPGRALLPGAEEAPPYPGAKPHLVVPPELWEDGERLAGLLAATAAALPAPKPRRPRKA